jgi:hypothetical protein
MALHYLDSSSRLCRPITSSTGVVIAIIIPYGILVRLTHTHTHTHTLTPGLELLTSTSYFYYLRNCLRCSLSTNDSQELGRTVISQNRMFKNPNNIPVFFNCLAVAQLVEALCYKPEGRGIESR